MLVNFKSFEWKYLGDVATIERSKKNQEYDAGCTLLQVSATRGEVVYHHGGYVDSKYAVIRPKNNIVPLYLYCVIKYRSIDKFMARYAQGLNIISDDIKRMEVPILDCIEEQYKFAKMWCLLFGDD